MLTRSDELHTTVAGPGGLKAAGSAGAEGSLGGGALVVHNASKWGALVHPNEGVPLSVEGVPAQRSFLAEQKLACCS